MPNILAVAIVPAGLVLLVLLYLAGWLHRGNVGRWR